MPSCQPSVNQTTLCQLSAFFKFSRFVGANQFRCWENMNSGCCTGWVEPGPLMLLNSVFSDGGAATIRSHYRLLPRAASSLPANCPLQTVQSSPQPPARSGPRTCNPIFSSVGLDCTGLPGLVSARPVRVKRPPQICVICGSGWLKCRHLP